VILQITQQIFNGRIDGNVAVNDDVNLSVTTGWQGRKCNNSPLNDWD